MNGVVKPFLMACFIVGMILSAYAQTKSAAGAWSGAINTPGVALQITVNLDLKDAKWTGAIDIPMQNVKGVPLTNIKVDGSTVGFAIAGIPGDPTFAGKLSEDGNTISGDFTQGPGKFPFTLSRK